MLKPTTTHQSAQQESERLVQEFLSKGGVIKKIPASKKFRRFR